jgi:hypothetical protein
MSLGNNNLDGTSNGKVNLGSEYLQPESGATHPAVNLGSEYLQPESGATHPAADWIARYEFANGAFATDETGNYNLTNNGASSVSDGTRGDVASFDGVNDYMALPSVPAGTLTGAGSWCFWIYSFTELEDVVLGGSTGTALIYSHLNGTLRFRGDGESLTIWSTDAQWKNTIDTWQFFCFTRDGVNAPKMYKNNLGEAPYFSSVNSTANMNLDWIGRWSTVYADCKLDNVTYYDRELTSSEITAIYDYEVL